MPHLFGARCHLCLLPIPNVLHCFTVKQFQGSDFGSLGRKTEDGSKLLRERFNLKSLPDGRVDRTSLNVWLVAFCWDSPKDKHFVFTSNGTGVPNKVPSEWIFLRHLIEPQTPTFCLTWTTAFQKSLASTRWQSSHIWYWMTYSTTNTCCRIAPFITWRHNDSKKLHLFQKWQNGAKYKSCHAMLMKYISGIWREYNDRRGVQTKGMALKSTGIGFLTKCQRDEIASSGKTHFSQTQTHKLKHWPLTEIQS